MHCRRLVVAFTVAALAPLAFGQSEPASAPAVAAPAAQGDAVAGMIDDLSSTSYATREAAQKALLAVPLDQIEHVRALAARVTDPEAAERLRAILTTLETIEVTTTPGVGVDVKDAPLGDVAAALSQSAGVTIGADAPGDNARFTLTVAGQPLWEVIDQLSRQHPLSIADRDGLVLKPANAASTRHRQIVRGVLFSISDPQMGGFAGAIRPRAWPSNMDVVVAVDPRINLFQAHPPVFHSVKDNLGHEIPLPEEDEAAKTLISDPARIWSREISLGAPMEMGDKITVTGSVTFSAILPEKPVEVGEPGKRVGEVLQVGSLKVTIRQLLATAAVKTANGSVNVRALGVKFEVIPETSSALPPDVGDMRQVGDAIHAPSYGKRSVFPVKGVGIGTFEMGNDDVTITDGVIRYDGAGGTTGKAGAPLELVALDATGRKIMAAQMTINGPCTAISVVQTDYQEPIKLVLRTGGIREATVPFEYKDLPLFQH